MRKKSEQTHSRIINAAYECFWRFGYTRTSVDGIAARAGVTKRTLYAHFRSKDNLLAEVLVQYEELVSQRLAHIGERMPADRRGLVEEFFNQLARWASTTPRWTGSGLSRLVMELADLPGHPARVMASRSKSTTEAWLVRRLVKARVARPRERACELMLLMEGAMVLTLVHSNRSYIDAAARAAGRLIGT